MSCDSRENSHKSIKTSLLKANKLSCNLWIFLNTNEILLQITFLKTFQCGIEFSDSDEIFDEASHEAFHELKFLLNSILIRSTLMHSSI